MPIPYYVSDALGALCDSLGLGSYYELLGGYHAFTPDNYDAAVSAVSDRINQMLSDNDDTNDATAFEYQDRLDTGYMLMYWSTEARSWV